MDSHTVVDRTGIAHTGVADIGVDRIEGSAHTVGRSYTGWFAVAHTAVAGKSVVVFDRIGVADTVVGFGRCPGIVADCSLGRSFWGAFQFWRVVIF